MRVIGPGAPGRVAPRRSAGLDADGAGFTRLVGGGVNTPTAASLGSTAALAALDALLMLQAVPDAAERRKRALKRGHGLLDRLEELRLALLDGVLPRTTLERLQAGLVQQGEAFDDPELGGLIGEIELRVAVELAKLDTLAAHP
jgi:hypothetical protein